MPNRQVFATGSEVRVLDFQTVYPGLTEQQGKVGKVVGFQRRSGFAPYTVLVGGREFGLFENEIEEVKGE